MKKYALILIGFVMVLPACSKKETTTVDAAAQATADDATIQAYLKTNNITNATKDASGLYYRVVTAGTAGTAYPTATSIVTVNYTGNLMSDGTQFDTTTGRGSFSTALTVNGVAQVIQGWVIGMQKVQTGGRIVLYIPSGLGYGPGGSGAIPANACLVFTIDLLGVK